MRLIAAFIVTVLMTSCIGIFSERGNGVRKKESFEVADFQRIDIGGNFIINLTEGEPGEVIIESDENLFDYIDLEVRGRTLIASSERMLDSEEGVIININVKNLEVLGISGAAEVKSTNPLLSADLAIILSGAGKLELMLDVEDVSLNVSGATLVYLEGAAKKLEIDMSGAGSLEASELEVEDCFAQISGLGKVLVNVSGRLEAEVSGLGSVEYLGNPESVRGDVSGIGNVSEK